MIGDCGDVATSLQAWFAWWVEQYDQFIQSVIDKTIEILCGYLGVPHQPDRELL